MSESAFRLCVAICLASIMGIVFIHTLRLSEVEREVDEQVDKLVSAPAEGGGG